MAEVWRVQGDARRRHDPGDGVSADAVWSVREAVVCADQSGQPRRAVHSSGKAVLDPRSGSGSGLATHGAQPGRRRGGQSAGRVREAEQAKADRSDEVPRDACVVPESGSDRSGGEDRCDCGRTAGMAVSRRARVDAGVSIEAGSDAVLHPAEDVPGQGRADRRRQRPHDRVQQELGDQSLQSVPRHVDRGDPQDAVRRSGPTAAATPTPTPPTPSRIPPRSRISCRCSRCSRSPAR